jgi:PAS domain S-box-containing protein
MPDSPSVAHGMTASLSVTGQAPDPATPATPKLLIPILLVDDNAARRLALRAMLQPLGYPIVEAGSGADALRCLGSKDFAVILLDVQMPVMNGFETAAAIRECKRSEMTPIIFITAQASDELLETDLWAHGAVDFVSATVPPNELRAKVSVFANFFARAMELAAQAQEVQASVDQLRLLTNAAPIGIFQTDANRKYVYANARWVELSGIPADEAIGRTCHAILDSAHDGTITEVSVDSAARNERSHRYEVKVPGAAPRVVLATAKAIPNGDGGIAGWVGTLSDVTAATHQEEADLARREAEQRYRQIVETTMEGIWLIDADERTTFVNEAMARMVGVTLPEFMELTVWVRRCPASGIERRARAVRSRRLA